MKDREEGQLQMGKVAFAKAFCAEWFSGHSKILFSCLVTFVVCIFCLFQFSNKFDFGKPDLIKNFSSIGKAEAPELLKQLENQTLSQGQFESQMAQRFLILGDVNTANLYVKEALKKSHDLTSSYYGRFSQNTLKISQGNYVSALEEAKQLKTDLEKDHLFWTRRDKFVKSGTLLYAYNLIRIAALEREAGSPEGELLAWKELVQNAGWEGQPSNLQMYDPEAYALLKSNFQEGEVSLLDFIEQRKAALSKN
jgi:hypothetical protein